MNDNIQTPTVDEKIAALIEGAYIQTPTQPGYWVKYDDVRNKFIELVSLIDSSKSQDFDNLFGVRKYSKCNRMFIQGSLCI